MRIGITGVGRIGLMHATNVAATPGVTELVLHDPVPGRAESVAADLRGTHPGLAVRAVGSDGDGYPQLLAGVDGVLVTTPTPTHAAAVHAALDAGVPTLVEKPIAGDLETMREIIAHAEQSGVPLLVGFQRRFDPAIAELKRRIAGGEIGDLYLVRAIAFDAEPPPAEYIPTSGGIFRDMFIHDLDCVPWLVGRPVETVHAAGSVLVDDAFRQAGDVDTVAITLGFAGGVIGQLSGGRRNGTGYDNRIEAVGSAQSLTSGLDARTPIISLEPGGHDPAGTALGAYPGFAQRYAPAYAAEVATFLHVISGKTENPSPARDSVISLILAQACEESLRTGATVHVDPSAYAGPHQEVHA